MAIGNVLKRVVTGVPRAAASLGKSLANEVAPGTFQTAPRSTGVLNPVPEPAAPVDEEPMFNLPELDPADPDFEEKKAIHSAYEQLATMLSESAAEEKIDTRAKYKEMTDYLASKPEPRRWSPLAGFAIGMGNPDALKQVAADNRAADDEVSKRDMEILRLQEEAIKGEISQAMQKQNFRKALTQSKLLAELAATQDRIKQAREHKNKLAEIETANKGKAEVARIKAASADRVVQERAKQMVDRYKLDAAAAKALYAIAGNYVSGLQRQVDAAGEPYYDRNEVESVLYKMVDFAEEHMDSRKEDDARETAPAPAGGAAPAPKTTSAGPKPNDSVRAAFEARRKARAQKQTK